MNINRIGVVGLIMLGIVFETSHWLGMVVC